LGLWSSERTIRICDRTLLIPRGFGDRRDTDARRHANIRVNSERQRTTRNSRRALRNRRMSPGFNSRIGASYPQQIPPLILWNLAARLRSRVHNFAVRWNTREYISSLKEVLGTFPIGLRFTNRCLPTRPKNGQTSATSDAQAGAFSFDRSQINLRGFVS
jgi:hypothetical protein